MHEIDRYPPGVPCWIDCGAPDPPAAAAFYGSLFDWSIADERGDRLIARRDGHDVAGIRAAAGDGGWTTYVRVDDSGTMSERAAAAGGQLLPAGDDARPLARTAMLADPSGIVFGVWEPIEHGGAQLVNAAGTWNWSNLATSDPEAALGFYASVFGWEGALMGEDVWMLRVPGYGDLLAERDPALRDRHAEPGVPEGFSDAVGWLTLPGGAIEPGWSVTFAVDDTDAVSARAGSLGATVLMAPRDEGPTRIAELRDPQGATFTISQYRSG